MAQHRLQWPRPARCFQPVRTTRAKLRVAAPPALYQQYQPTLVSTTSIEASGLYTLEFVGDAVFDDSHCEVSYPFSPGLPLLVATAHAHHPLASFPNSISSGLQQLPGLELLDNPAFLPRAGLEALFSKVAFKQESAEVLCERLQQGACRVVWARSTAGDLHWPGVPTVVGTAFAVLDGMGQATLWNVCVDPAWQQRGLGRALVHRLVAVLQQQEGVRRVALCSSEDTLCFYERLGFRLASDASVFI